MSVPSLLHPPERRFDVAVIGGGPAGAAAALAAAQRGLRVAIFEPQQDLLDKPCGEGLMAEGVTALVELGVREILSSGREFHALRYYLPLASPLELCLPQSGLALRRPALMLLLLSEFAAYPALLRIPCKAVVQKTSKGYEIQSQGALFFAATLIVADGLGGACATWLREPRRPRVGVNARYGLRARFHDLSGLNEVEVHLGRHSEVYLTPLPQGLLNVAVLSATQPGERLNSRERLATALAEHPAARAHLGSAVGPVSSRRLDSVPPCSLSDGTSFLVGDAGGGVDPILGCGLSIALRSGIEAARCAQAFLRGVSQKELARTYERFFRREVRARRWLASLLLASAAHPRLAQGLATLLQCWPGLSRPLLHVAAGRSHARAASPALSA